jgi:type II secretory pathway predicted ATPase ExeA
VEESSRRGDQPEGQTPEVSHYDLWAKPFRENTDPSVLWLGPQYRDAFATLRAAVLQNVGFLLLTGGVGTGKTILAGALADSLRGEGVRVAKLAYPGLHPHELRNGVAQAFGLPVPPDTRESFLAHFGEFLDGAYARRERVLLVIDEAQNLGPALLDEIDDLARAGREAGRGKVNLVNILLVGQTSIDAILRRRNPRARADHIAVRSYLGVLAPEEVADYVAFRLRAAGADRELFLVDAIRVIAAASGGVPRLINRICDYALLVASQRKERVVSADIVRLSLDAFGLAAPGGHRRQHSREGTRRIAYAAAIALAIGLGAVLYHGGRASDLRHEESHENPGLRAGEGSAATTMPSATGERTPPTEPAVTTRSMIEAEGEGVANGQTTDLARLAVQPATSAPSGPREDVARVPKTPVSETRAESARQARARIAAPAIGGKGEPSPAITDRRAVEASGPSSVATSPQRPIARGSEESDDPAAIINWLLQGNRPAAER